MFAQAQDALTRLTQAFMLCSEHDTQKRKFGEKEIANMALDRNYPLILLEYIMKSDSSNNRLRAAIEFKRWTTDDWTKTNLQDIEFSEVHKEIKNIILRVWIGLHNKEEALIRESILSIAKYEFPVRWENMTTTLMGFLDPNQITSEVNLRIFKVLSNLTAKYEYSSRSDPLSLEVILVANTTAEYLLHFANNLLTFLTQNIPNDIGAITALLKLLKQVTKCFYYLNCQDIPEKIENYLPNWMQALSQTLNLDLSQLGDEIRMEVFKCKGESLRAILLFFTKYREDVEDLVKTFSQQIYEVCMKLSDNDSSNKFILNAMKYFKNLLYWSDLRSFFSGNMESILQTLVFKMEKPTAEDIEIFDVDQDAFVENVLNNAGGSSRKNTVNDLAKALSRVYTQEVVPVLKNLLEQYIQLFQNNQPDPVNEITIINILVDMGVSKFTPKTGVTELLLPTEFFTYFYDAVIEPSLSQLFQISQSDQNFNIDSLNLFHISHLIRYVYFFRNYLDKIKLLEVIKNISCLLKSKNDSFKKVLYHSIEGLITIKDNMDVFAPSNFFYNKENAYPNIQYLLENLYLDVKAGQDLNPYALRALYNIIKIMDDSSAKFVDAFCDLFKDMITKLTKAYDFNTIFLVFDGLSSFITYSKDNSEASEKVYKEIFPQIDNIIMNNHADMLSYAFQIYALGMHFYNLPLDKTKLLFDSLMNTKNWEKDNGAMFPAYLMFIEEAMVKFPDLLWNNLETIQNILSIVLIENQQDQLFFTFANKVVLFWDLAALHNSNLLNTLLRISFRAIIESQNDTANKENNTPVVRGSLGKNVLLFWCLCIVKFTFESFVQEIQSAFGQDFDVFYRFLLQEVNVIKSYQKQPERKVMMNGIESIIFSSIYDKIDTQVWQTLLNAVVENICRRRKQKSFGDFGDSSARHIVTGYSSNFQKLTWFAAQKLPYSELPDEDSRFINEFQSKFGANAQQVLTQALDPKLLKAYQELYQ